MFGFNGWVMVTVVLGAAEFQISKFRSCCSAGTSNKSYARHFSQGSTAECLPWITSTVNRVVGCEPGTIGAKRETCLEYLKWFRQLSCANWRRDQTIGGYCPSLVFMPNFNSFQQAAMTKLETFFTIKNKGTCLLSNIIFRN